MVRSAFLSLAHSDYLAEDLAEINSISVFSFPTIAATFHDFQGVAVQDARIERIGHQALRLHIRNRGVTLAERHMGDGLIITGALGSTGYNRSAGGEALSLDSKEFLLTPICPFATGRVFDSLPKPVKIDQLDLELTPESTARLVLDNRSFEIPAGTTVRITQGAENFRLLVKRGVQDEYQSSHYPTETG